MGDFRIELLDDPFPIRILLALNEVRLVASAVVRYEGHDVGHLKWRRRHVALANREVRGVAQVPRRILFVRNLLQPLDRRHHARTFGASSDFEPRPLAKTHVERGLP